MSTPKETSDVALGSHGSSEQSSTAPESDKQTNVHAERYYKLHKFFGFTKGYNFPLWIIFAGGMLGFSLAKLQDLDYDGHFKHEFALVPGYWYYFSHGHFRYGMLIHLCCILPAGILVVFQFVPVIRHKFILFHRINGYIVTLLGLVSNLSAFVVIRHDQGGGQRIAAQSAEYLMGIITTVGLVLAVYNVRRKQIDQHRAWMLRTWFWMGVTITARLINLAATPIITRLGHHWAIWTCDEIDFLYKNMEMPFPESTWPECFLSDGSLDVARRVAVHANEKSHILPEIGLSYTITFGTMLWVMLVIHTVGVELYLAMTPREAERLRRVSYEKQLEAGFRNPGSAGLVLDKWGDADAWTPKQQ